MFVKIVTPFVLIFAYMLYEFVLVFCGLKSIKAFNILVFVAFRISFHFSHKILFIINDLLQSLCLDVLHKLNVIIAVKFSSFNKSLVLVLFPYNEPTLLVCWIFFPEFSQVFSSIFAHLLDRVRTLLLLRSRRLSFRLFSFRLPAFII